MADAHGTVWAVGERECSIQRRHQKIIEEAPSPLVERIPGMRAKLFEAARLAAEAIGYTGAGTVEFMADDRRRLLLPRDEHPPAGRAPGHRGDHRPRPGRAAAAGRRRRPLWTRNRLPRADIRSRRGSTPRIPPRTGSRRPGPIHRFEVPTTLTEFGLLGRGRRARRLRRRRRVGRCRCSTTRCWPRSSPTRRRAGRPPRSWPTRWPAPGCTASRPTATCWSTCCGIRRSSTAPPTRRSSTPTDWPSWPRPLADPSATALSALAAALADAAENRSAQRYSVDCPAAGATSPSGFQTKRYVDAAGDEHEVRYRFGRGGLELDGRRHHATLVSSTPTRVVLAIDGVERPFDVARYGPESETSSSTPRSDRSS